VQCARGHAEHVVEWFRYIDGDWEPTHHEPVTLVVTGTTAEPWRPRRLFEYEQEIRWRYELECPRCPERVPALRGNLHYVLTTLSENGVFVVSLGGLRECLRGATPR